MDDEITIVMPAGMMGANEFDTRLDTLLRTLGERHQTPGGWGEKYGATVDNEVFMMHPFCWCNEEACPWCESSEQWGEGCAPNFWYKPLDFRVHWYKFIGRGVETNKELTESEFMQMVRECLLVQDEITFPVRST